MSQNLQDVVSLLVVALAAAYLVWRSRCFYLSLKTKSQTRCGGCACRARSRPPVVPVVRLCGRNDELRITNDQRMTNSE